MKTNKRFFKLPGFSILAIFLTFLYGCSGGDDTPSEPSPTSPTVVTSEAIPVNPVTYILGGNITSSGNSSLQQHGIIYGTNPNPTSNNSEIIVDNSDQTGEFSITVSGLLPNTQYYFRAYARNLTGEQLGNVLSFTTGALVVTLETTNILTTSALLKGEKLDQELVHVGFVYGTDQNPTINDNLVSELVNGPDTYEMEVTNLLPNTVYYVRSYLNTNNGASYGEQKQFRTTGYFGPGGGYVFYDKGVTQDSWRYLEVYPETLSYNPSQTTGSAWGNNSFVSGTFDAFGSGLDNSNVIASNVTQANCAAKLCLNATIGGKSDWFLPSSQEMLTAANAMQDMGIFLGNSFWTSTQTNAEYAKVVSFDSPPPTYSIFPAQPKTINNIWVLPVRRY
ncbi:NDNF family FN3 domain-containing protein [Flavobacterium selenitireducens]|uniref:hypothetical protein n=1 Tax=Flavobacterium selenitireducens TaxID=2722704 RepID=UPI00168ABEBF|nr:hypothetical protein [Flavobacterium selenitireducens]MBD3581879.1 hypothetical protein [Flavobacterium selenitireducens]